VCDYSFRTADGSYKLISDTRTLIKEPDDEMSHITGIWQDITEKKRLQKDTLIRMYPRKRDGFGYIVGLSSPMQEVYERVSKIIAMDVKTVLILGETGTGKDLISRTIHDLSSRRTHPYTEINCANIPENLLESELFGYEKGAFTDAKGLKRGLFEQALTGTILLNEIGHMRLDLQAKLLRVIEHRTFRRVGGTKDLDIDVRILAATNKSLWEAVENGEFREDLYYRIKLVPIYMPPLRKRKEDIPLLIGHLLRQANREFKKDVRGVTKDAEAMMLAYDWPGNVRELKNVIERAVILGDKNQIRIDNLPKEIVVNKKDDPAELELSGKDLSLTGIEKKMIEEALKKTDGNQVQAARLLKLSRHAMRYRMKKYGFL
ncbi:MAG: sigma-54 interaction domain-containing protein, partial [Desulfobacterales bacterium]